MFTLVFGGKLALCLCLGMWVLQVDLRIFYGPMGIGRHFYDTQKILLYPIFMLIMWILTIICIFEASLQFTNNQNLRNKTIVVDPFIFFQVHIQSPLRPRAGGPKLFNPQAHPGPLFVRDPSFLYQLRYSLKRHIPKSMTLIYVYSNYRNHGVCYIVLMFRFGVFLVIDI